jgi:hypothetical protein
MAYTMYQHGDKVEQMETRIGKMRHGFNYVMSDDTKAGPSCNRFIHIGVESPR